MAGRLAGRIALVTGASRGIGAAVARRFAEEGAQLVLLARTVGGLEETDDAVRKAGAPPAVLVPLDLRDFAALDRLGQSLHERFGRLDVLVANAGALGELMPIHQYTPALFEEVMAVNVTASFRLIRSLHPLLLASDAGRAIFVTSGAARGERPYWGAYAVSKAALEALARVYAGETRKTAIRVNLLDPGATRTAMRAKAYPGEDPASLKPPEALADLFLELAVPGCSRHGDVVSP